MTRTAIRSVLALAKLLIALVAGLASFPGIGQPGVNNSNALQRSSNSASLGGWRFVRTPNPGGGPDAVSIMRTADMSRSDIDFVGLMMRCREGRIEAVIVLVNPLPPHLQPKVAVGKPGQEIQLEATIGAPGTVILFPGDAARLVEGPWRGLSDLFIRVDDGHNTTRGVVALDGLQAAIKMLVANCSPP